MCFFVVVIVIIVALERKHNTHTHIESQVYHSFYPRSLQDQHDYSSEGNSNIVLSIVF